LGIDGGDHPIFGNFPGDAPPPVGAIGSVRGLDVLPGGQRQHATACAAWGQIILPRGDPRDRHRIDGIAFAGLTTASPLSHGQHRRHPTTGMPAVNNITATARP
jgi:hypothetical protein